MNGEIYVQALIDASPHARGFIIEQLGLERSEILARLADPNYLSEIASRLNCEIDDVFIQLTTLIERRFLPEHLPLFTRSHMEKLPRASILYRLGKLSGLHKDEVIDHLFNRDALLRTLQGIDSSSFDKDTTAVLYKLLSKRETIENIFEIQPQEWGQLMLDEQWLSVGETVEQLRVVAKEYEWSPGDPTRILAALIDDIRIQRIFDYETIRGATLLDSLGMSFLRQQLRWLAQRLREEAQRLADTAALLAPEYDQVALLSIWLKMYETGAINSAIKDATKWRLIDVLDDYKVTSVVGQPDPDAYLIVRDSRVKKGGIRFLESQYCGLEVACKLNTASQSTVILQCDKVPKPLFDHLYREINSLRVLDLSTSGESLGQRLLNTPINPQQSVVRILKLLSNDLEETLTQIIALTGTMLPFSMSASWTNQLSENLSFTPYLEEEDCLFEFSTTEILRDLEAKYQHNSDHIKVIRGVDCPGNLIHPF